MHDVSKATPPLCTFIIYGIRLRVLWQVFYHIYTINVFIQFLCIKMYKNNKRLYGLRYITQVEDFLIIYNYTLDFIFIQFIMVIITNLGVDANESSNY